MLELPVITIEGKDTGRKVVLPEAIFDTPPHAHAVYLDVKQIRANQRQGTHKTKEKGEVRASTRKLIKQKGTGNARKGSAKSPILKGGGRVFGPRPRAYGFKLNKKVKDLARKSALASKAQNNGITVLEDFTWPVPKTRQYVSMLNQVVPAAKKTLLVLPEPQEKLLLASRNLQDAQVTTAAQLNTYAILKAQQILLTEQALTLLHEKWSPSCAT